MATEPNVSGAEDERHRMTLEALADVDAGRVIDHETVQAWAARVAHGPSVPGSGEARAKPVRTGCGPGGTLRSRR